MRLSGLRMMDSLGGDGNYAPRATARRHMSDNPKEAVQIPLKIGPVNPPWFPLSTDQRMSSRRRRRNSIAVVSVVSIARATDGSGTSAIGLIISPPNGLLKFK